MDLRRLCSLLFVFLVLGAGTAAAQSPPYWPTDAERTFVFGPPSDERRLAIDPTGGDAAQFVALSPGCLVSWTGVVQSDGRLVVDVASFFCPGVVDPVLELTFPLDTAMFDPEWSGRPVQVVPATSGEAEFSLYVRVSETRSVTTGEGTFEALEMVLGVEPLLEAPLLTVDLTVDDGPIRADGLDRTAILAGIVGGESKTWSRLKARFDEGR